MCDTMHCWPVQELPLLLLDDYWEYVVMISTVFESVEAVSLKENPCPIQPPVLLKGCEHS